ncbi:hypothetical protein KIW84_042645 [Lathyrus oleraceus]|uniref:Uncharacterized protein n=1 Tax=Pisum sativum TaxID=3888 RepID=A0A9D4XD81_PEA|nr:hypothetical protein KIW84_042645 [Pisum sativum]
MTSPRPHEETSSAGDTTTSQTADVGSSMASAISAMFVGPILTLCQPQTPTPITMGTFGQYIPNFIVLMHMTLGMLTEFIASMHNLGSNFAETSPSPFPRYQGLGPLATPFGRPPGFGLASQSVPTFTLRSVVVMRQQMDESNHEMGAGSSESYASSSIENPGPTRGNDRRYFPTRISGIRTYPKGGTKALCGYG